MIVSGGIERVIEPFARLLGLAEAQVLAVQAHFNSNGDFQALDFTNGMADSKFEGASRVLPGLAGRKVIIGDGTTDMELWEKGLTHEFIAYTEHARRDKVISKAPHAADSMLVVEKLLKEI